MDHHVRWPPHDADHLLVDAAQMLALEQALFRSGLPQAALMEKVGLAMTERLLTRPDLLREGVLVLVGPGHNGGDGLVVARSLHASGIHVRLWIPLPVRRELTASHLQHARWLGLDSVSDPPDPRESCLWIDAVFGLGQTRPLPPLLADLFDRRQVHQPNHLVSLDLPSGLCSDSGLPIQGKAATAGLTLCVGLRKRGVCFDSALPFVGEVERIDLGLADHQIQALPLDLPLRFGAADLDSLPFPPLARTSSKYARGRVLIVAGSDAYRGAAALALQGALASGCGSVQAVIPGAVAEGLWQSMPEVVCRSDSSPPALERLDAVLFGPGLGRDPSVWSQWSTSLRCFAGLLVLDADGINALAATGQGSQWLRERSGPTWLTPHRAEFQRLFGDIGGGDPLRDVMLAARSSGATVLLKGAHSVIGDAQERALLMDGTSPLVARTGFGDLLAGFAAGHGAMWRASGHKPRPAMLAAAALLHAQSVSISSSGRPSELGECLEKLVFAQMKKMSRVIKI